MGLISRHPGGFKPRTSGIYGHLPILTDGMVTSVGYLRLVTKKNLYTLWYMGNPYRHKVFEKSPHYRNGFGLKEN